jgi:hypothetical protein
MLECLDDRTRECHREGDTSVVTLAHAESTRLPFHRDLDLQQGFVASRVEAYDCDKCPERFRQG